jgi:hypothetical protein
LGYRPGVNSRLGGYGAGAEKPGGWHYKQQRNLTRVRSGRIDRNVPYPPAMISHFQFGGHFSPAARIGTMIAHSDTGLWICGRCWKRKPEPNQ